MIFVTVGSQKFPFDRLLKKIDQLVEAGKITDAVFAQTGYSNDRLEHCASAAFLDRDAFAQKLDQADLVITHAGTGTIVGAIKRGKRVIAVPRRRQYGEHVDDHQLQILHQFESAGLICACYEVDGLEQALQRAQQMQPAAYVSNTGRIIQSIEAYLEGTEQEATQAKR